MVPDRVVDRTNTRTAACLGLTLCLDEAVVVISVDGDVDHHTGDKLRHVVNGVLATGVESLVLDCADLRFIDSGGIAVLAEAVGHTEARGGTLTIAHPTKTMVRLLAITGLADRVTIK